MEGGRWRGVGGLAFNISPPFQRHNTRFISREEGSAMSDLR